MLQVNLDLKKGIGVSLINKQAEEILYINLNNLTLDYQSDFSGVKMDISVANVQVNHFTYVSPCSHVGSLS